MRILFVEDEPMVKNIICSFLRRLGHDVIEMTDGDAAIMKLDHEDQEFDLLVTDIRMPGTSDGWDVAEHARRIFPTIAVLYVTAWSKTPPRPVPESLTLQKPFTVQQLNAAIADLVPLLAPRSAKRQA